MPGSTQLFVASTLYGVLNLAAAIDSDQFGGQDRDQQPDGDRGRVRRLLLISNNAALPEISPSPAEMPGFDLLAKRFDRVLSYNAAIAPFHPSAWNPRPIDTPILQRHLRNLWELGDDDLHLVVESLQVNPAQTICRLFPDASIDVYADGLMSYGPTRNGIDPLTGTRLCRLLYAELVPGLRPLLLDEWGITPSVIPTAAIRQVVEELPDSYQLPSIQGVDSNEPVALLLGQYLSALDILTEQEEEELHRRMLICAIRRGHRKLIFKPHPNAPRELAMAIRAEADRRHVELLVLQEPSLVEALYVHLRVEAVYGCFSTALMTASALFDIPTYRVGTELMLERLSPYHNSNRIPVTIIDAVIPDAVIPDAVNDGGSSPQQPSLAAVPDELVSELVATVSYVMQPRLRPQAREQAERFLRLHYADYARYFRRRRLGRLGLLDEGAERRVRLPRLPRRMLGRLRREVRRRVARGRSTPR